MIGRYIDVLAAHEKWDAIDRVIQADRWITRRVYNSDGRCLIGHTEDWTGYDPGIIAPRDQVATSLRECVPGLRYRNVPFPSPVLYHRTGLHQGIGDRFDRLVKRFGLERVVRLVKMRAGKHTRVDVGQKAEAVGETLPQQGVPELHPLPAVHCAGV